MSNHNTTPAVADRRVGAGWGGDMNLLEHSSATRRRLQKVTGILAVITLLGVFPDASVLAQIGANVGGIVTDNSGAVLTGVTITNTNKATGQPQAHVTRTEGHHPA